MQIKELKAKIIKNSRAEETIEAVVKTSAGSFRASVASGVSRGRGEAAPLSAKEARQAIEKEIAPALLNRGWNEQKELDDFLIGLDGTENKNRLGANSLLAVSMAGGRALAKEAQKPLWHYLNLRLEQGRGQTPTQAVKVRPSLFKAPRMCFNILEGGAHVKNKLALQEFIVVPNEGSAKKNLEAGKKVCKALGRILKENFGRPGIVLGDEGGYSPPVADSATALALIKEALEQSGLEKKTEIALDAAASQFYKNDIYFLDGLQMKAEELADFYLGLARQYRLVFIEDPFAETDWPAWQNLNLKLKIKNLKLTLAGDDLTVTNPERIKKAQEKGLCRAVIIKPNQIGTVSEAVEAARLAKDFGWQVVVSHRSGETMDSFISDLAAAAGADFIKAGAPGPKERLAKYERLLQIEKELGRIKK